MANLNKVIQTTGDTVVNVLNTFNNSINIVNNSVDVLHTKVNNWKEYSEKVSKEKLSLNLKEHKVSLLEAQLSLDTRIQDALAKRGEVKQYFIDDNGSIQEVKS